MSIMKSTIMKKHNEEEVSFVPDWEPTYIDVKAYGKEDKLYC